MSRSSGILKVSKDKGTGFTTEELELIAEDPTYYLFADVRFILDIIYIARGQ